MKANKRDAAAPQAPAASPARFKGSYLPDRSAKSVTRGEALTVLAREIAPVPEKLASLLGLPEKTYLGGDFFNYLSISSQKGLDGKAVAAALLIGQPFPEDVPDYAIFITNKGSSRFCVFVDKERRIMAYAPLSALMVEGAGWGGLQSRIEEALEAAGAYVSRNVQFKFVIRGERHPDARI